MKLSQKVNLERGTIIITFFFFFFFCHCIYYNSVSYVFYIMDGWEVFRVTDWIKDKNFNY